MNAHEPCLSSRDAGNTAGENFRSAMRQLASGVCVITTGRGEERTGLTATSVSSLSMEPPTLVVCIDRTSKTLKAIRKNQVFGVNVLAAGHRSVADRFAGRCNVSGAARYQGSEWINLVTGAPLLADALAAIDCTIETIMEWSTHAVVIGRVEAIHQPGGAQALVYWRQTYRNLR